MTQVLAGRTALVTGGGRGIGRATAVALAGAGANVVVLARTAAELEVTAERIRAAGGRCAVVRADLAEPSGIGAVADRAGEAFGPVDILVNNAAVVWPLGPSAVISPESWAGALTVNVAAAAALTFALLPGMLERGWGRVVNISSAVAGRGRWSAPTPTRRPRPRWKRTL